MVVVGAFLIFGSNSDLVHIFVNALLASARNLNPFENEVEVDIFNLLFFSVFLTFSEFFNFSSCFEVRGPSTVVKLRFKYLSSDFFTFPKNASLSSFLYSPFCFRSSKLSLFSLISSPLILPSSFLLSFLSASPSQSSFLTSFFPLSQPSSTSTTPTTLQLLATPVGVVEVVILGVVVGVVILLLSVLVVCLVGVVVVLIKGDLRLESITSLSTFMLTLVGVTGFDSSLLLGVEEVLVVFIVLLLVVVFVVLLLELIWVDGEVSGGDGEGRGDDDDWVDRL